MSDRVKDLPKNLMGPALEKFRDLKASFKLPETPKAAREVLDSFGPKALNHLIKNLKGMLSLRADRVAELAAKKQMAEAARAGLAAHGQTAKHGDAATLVMKGGKAVSPQTEAEVSQAAAQVGTPPKGVASEAESKKGLTLFEKVLLARFEQNQPLGEKLEPGRQQFLAKTPEGWRAFFQKFLPFSIQKKGNVAELEAVVYRGLVEEQATVERGRSATMTGKKAPQAPLLISDLKFQSRTDRFARMEVPNSILMKLASLMPGETLEKALLSEWLGGPEFAYTALSHKIVQPDLIRAMAVRPGEKEKEAEGNPALQSALQRSSEQAHQTGREPTKGIALTARAEQMASEQLELSWRADSTGRPESGGRPGVTSPTGAHGGKMASGGGALAGLLKTRRKKGLFASMWGGEEGASGTGGVFVPWYQQLLRFKKHPGRPKWFVPLIYFVFFSTVALSAVYIFKFLLQK